MTLIEITVEVDKNERRGYGEFFRDISGFEDEFYAELPKVMKRAQNEARKTALKPLREYPPAWRSKQSRFKWSNDRKKNARARAYWFSHGKKKTGDGSYKRTGNMGKAWALDMSLSGDNTYGTLRIYNKHAKSSYVYGSSEFNWQRVPSHERTGWLQGNGEPMSQAVENTFDIFFDQIAKATAMLADGL